MWVARQMDGSGRHLWQDRAGPFPCGRMGEGLALSQIKMNVYAKGGKEEENTTPRGLGETLHGPGLPFSLSF